MEKEIGTKRQRDREEEDKLSMPDKKEERGNTERARELGIGRKRERTEREMGIGRKRDNEDRKPVISCVSLCVRGLLQMQLEVLKKSLLIPIGHRAV